MALWLSPRDVPTESMFQFFMPIAATDIELQFHALLSQDFDPILVKPGLNGLTLRQTYKWGGGGGGCQPPPTKVYLFFFFLMIKHHEHL